MTGPLEGIRIVEMATMIAVPASTNLLAQQGADIVKVENTTGGDDLRRYGSQRGGMSGWFANANAGKRSIGLDLSSDEGKDILWRLLAEADVFIQGFRPGGMGRLGFGPDDVLARFPSIVYASLSGFGTSGPYANRPVFDPVIQSLAGWAGNQVVDGAPTLVRGFVADKVAALTASQAVAAALVSRERKGVGQHIELSMFEANLAFNWPDVMMHETVLSEDATHMPNLLGVYRLSPASDGWVSVTAGTDGQWVSLCNALDRPELAVDERFATASGRNANMPAWYEAFDEMVAQFSTGEVLERLVAADVPAVPVLSPSEVASNEQVVARDAVRVVEHPVVGPMRSARPGARFEGDGEASPRPAPRYAEHTDQLLSELGFDASAIEGLRSRGTVV